MAKQNKPKFLEMTKMKPSKDSKADFHTDITKKNPKAC